jgi:glycine dehydrogenase subunit 1
MAYGSHTDEDRRIMLDAIGMRNVGGLFADIPEKVRAKGLDLPAPAPEQVLANDLERIAARNDVTPASFLGAGVYNHYVPAIVDEITRRSEFSTAYTPYQPEVSQGTLQAIYEFQSMIAELTGMEVVSASHYDGASATAEACLMAMRATKRERVLISRGLHPHFGEVVKTYFDGRLYANEIPTKSDGTTDFEALEQMLGEGDAVAGVVLAQPNVFGVIEDMAAASSLAHARGALFVAVVEPTSLAVLAPPGEYGADIAAGEGQPLGISPQFGGPYLGLLACTDKLMRQIPGRVVGRTTDTTGRRAYVMTMRAREQDIRREKAASNICTNQALCALAATVYLAAVGPRGLENVAGLGAANARELEEALARAGASRVHTGAYLNEFAIRVPDAERVHKELLQRGVLAGFPLGRWFTQDEQLRDSLLVCTTETTTSGEIALFTKELTAQLSGVKAA